MNIVKRSAAPTKVAAPRPPETSAVVLIENQRFWFPARSGLGCVTIDGERAIVRFTASRSGQVGTGQVLIRGDTFIAALISARVFSVAPLAYQDQVVYQGISSP